MTTPLPQRIRPLFPALHSHHSAFTFADNAGGSQTLAAAADRMLDFLLRTNVQMGSGYMGESTARCLGGAQEAARKMLGAESADEVVLGGSSTANVEALCRGLEGGVRGEEGGWEVVVMGEHEGNAGPWKSLASHAGGIVKTWHPRALERAPDSRGRARNPYAVGYSLDDLRPLLGARTRFVAVTACSNILGSVMPVADMVRAVRETVAARGGGKVEVCVDCVALAPHRACDVRGWGVDFAVFSYYKVYGPHVSAMYVKSSSLETSVSSIVHHFLSPGVDATGYKLQPQGPGYESAWASTAVVPYIESLGQDGTLDSGYREIEKQDGELAKGLLEGLGSDRFWDRNVRIVGEEKATRERLPTVSFVVDGRGSREVVEEFDTRGKIGIRYGHFYAYSLVKNLLPDRDPADGVIRVSFVHYNTMDDVKLFLDTLDEVLDSKVISDRRY